MTPLAIDLFCGLGGWAEGFLAEGFEVIGFDLERFPYPGQLILQDVRTIDGSRLKNAAIIVASPPCNEYSYRAMPWKRAKALPPPSNELFDTCFRIQREACQAAGRHIPLVVENVRGAQKWVGRAKWRYGSYYLWGDVPALMPWSSVGEYALKWGECNGKRFDERPKGNVAAHREGTKTNGHVNMCDGYSHTRHLTNQEEHGIKMPGNRLSENGFTIPIARQIDKTTKPPSFVLSPDDRRQHLSYSRKAASALIAKIPFPLAQHIARVWKPREL